MNNKRKIFLTILLACIILLIFCLSIDGFGSEPEFYTLYNKQNQTLLTNDYKEVDDLLASKEWSLSPPITIYNRQNETKIVFTSESYEYYASGEWFNEPSVLMYAKDGRTQYFLQSKAPAQATVGWYYEPLILMYAADGRTQYFLQSKAQAQSTVGWYYTKEEAQPKPKAVFTYSVYTKSNLSVEQLNQALAGTYLAGCGQDFYDMEQEHNINALFAIGVSGAESSYGKHQANKNNFWGRKASSSTWMSFPSKRDSILSFGQYMNKSMYYGKSIENINKIYCPGDGGYWASSVKKCMNDRWNKIAF